MLSGMFLRTSRVPAVSMRRSVVTGLCTLLIASALPFSWAQEEKTVDLKPRQETLIAKDGFRIATTYWPSGLKQDAAVVVLLHGSSGNQLDWGALPKQLQSEGYAVLAIDLRGHGQSKGANEDVDTKPAKNKAKSTKTGKAAVEAASLRARDYEAMVLGDMEAVKQFIFTEHQGKKLNMNRTAFVGAGMGAAVALKAAAVDWGKKPHSDGPVGNQTPRGQDVRALVLLTPDSEVPGLPLPDAIKVLRVPLFQVAFMFGVGDKDKLDRGQTKKLFDQAVSLEKNDQRMYLQVYKTPNRGTGMLGKGVEANISVFLKKHLQEISSEWRDRESRVGRKKAT